MIALNHSASWGEKQPSRSSSWRAATTKRTYISYPAGLSADDEVVRRPSRSS